MERRFLCKQCWHIFDVATNDDSSSSAGLRCPACLSTDVMEAPAWAALGSGLNIFDSNEWKYECQQCKHKFTMPIPKSPSEDKSRRCPMCNSKHLHLLTGEKALPLYCG
jgi:DNA-directed RNA polymerase subunit RPC12/RpoP